MLLGLTALSSYSWSSIRQLKLPVSAGLSALAVAIPLLNLLFLSNVAAQPSTLTVAKARTPRLAFGTTVLLILDAVLVTLAATHLPAGSTKCSLEAAWSGWFRAHDANAIRRVQDAFDCCGFNSPLDRAYPFQASHVNATACMTAFHRTDSCHQAWQASEHRNVSVFVAVGAVLAGVKAIGFLWAYYQAVAQNRAGYSVVDDEAVEDEQAARRRIEDVSEEPESGTNGHDNDVSERSRLLPAASAGPWGDHVVGEREEHMT